MARSRSRSSPRCPQNQAVERAGAEPLFELSAEELKGTCELPADVGYGSAYVDEETKDVKPAVNFVSAPPSDIIAIYRAVPNATAGDMIKWGEAARVAIDASLDKTGVVLLRGVPAKTEQEFAEFWKGCMNAAACSPWEPAVYINMGKSRQQVAGVDTATNIPPHVILNTHNELSYNPIRPSRIALYCLENAVSGGESIIARNEDITATVSPKLVSYIRDHGGLKYSRSYSDAAAQAKGGASNSWLAAQLGVTWQEKCGLPEGASRKEAEDFWVANGFLRENLEWDEHGTLRVSNVETGFIIDKRTNQQTWLNNADTCCMCADGTRVPVDLLKEFQRDRWKATHGFKLQPGDWLMLDNLRVQHGRLPYIPEPVTRRLLTVYTK